MEDFVLKKKKKNGLENQATETIKSAEQQKQEELQNFLGIFSANG